MQIKDFEDDLGCVCVYKTPYIKNRKIISPGIVIFNKVFIYLNPLRKDRVNKNSYMRIWRLNPRIWVKGVYNSGPIYYIKMAKDRWKKTHETNIEDWNKFDFIMPFKKGITKSFIIPFSISSFVNPRYFKPVDCKKEYDLLLVDHFDKRFKTQIILAKTIMLFRKKFKKSLKVLFLGSIRDEKYHNILKRYLEDHSIGYRIDLLQKEDYLNEVNRCKINLTLRNSHGSPRAVNETASCGLPQIITDGFDYNAASNFYDNMASNKKYRLGVKFKHNDITDLAYKMDYVLRNLDKFNTREYVLKEENCFISQKKMNFIFKDLFSKKGYRYEYKKNQIIRLGKFGGTSLSSFYNTNLRRVEELTNKISSRL